MPVLEILDVFCIDNNISYEILPDEEMDSDVLAETDIFNNVIRIKESIYNNAIINDGLARMTIVHEIGHYVLLKIFGIVFCRKIGKSKTQMFMDPEWQAKCFAGETMIDDILTSDMSIEEIKEQCEVSYPAARYQYNINHKK